jgi:predicted RNA binding protein YcfA (HicA-like mRNA interferase family)
MGRQRYPPLTPSEVVAILIALKFTLKRQVGSHCIYELPGSSARLRSVVTVDMNESDFDKFLIKSMIRQSNHSREEFYGATERTRKKIQP